MVKPYSGALAKPLDSPQRGFGAIQSVASARARKQDHQRMVEIKFKVLVLLNYFGIDYADPLLWERLALALASKHVRGFQEKGKPGAREKWTVFVKWDLKKAVDRKISEGGKSGAKSVTWACEVLSKRVPWKSLLAHEKKSNKASSPGEALRHVYYQACREIQKAEKHSAIIQE